jgi:hypothetical protein
MTKAIRAAKTTNATKQTTNAKRASRRTKRGSRATPAKTLVVIETPPTLTSSSSTVALIAATPPAPDPTYEDIVAEGERLVDEMTTTNSRVQWRLGELADLVEPEDGKPRYRDQTLSKFATRIGLNRCTVARYRTVFRAWKEILQKSAPGLLLPYTVARELAGLDNREKLIMAANTDEAGHAFQ